MTEMQAKVWERMISLMDEEPIAVVKIYLDERLQIPCAIEPCTSECEPDEFTLREMLERLR